MNSTTYASMVGAVRFLADTSHPLLSFSVQRLATALQTPGKRYLAAVHLLLGHLRLQVHDGLDYRRQPDGRLDLLAYSDSDYAPYGDTKRRCSRAPLKSPGLVAARETSLVRKPRWNSQPLLRPAGAVSGWLTSLKMSMYPFPTPPLELLTVPACPSSHCVLPIRAV